jgi:hypothetical protein
MINNEESSRAEAVQNGLMKLWKQVLTKCNLYLLWGATGNDYIMVRRGTG